MGSRYELFIWFLTVVTVTAGVWGINNPMKDMKLNMSLCGQKEGYNLALDKIQVYPLSKKSMIISILEKELPETKFSLLKKIEIKDGEVYVILYNDVSCRLGDFEDLNRKLNLILKILSTAREKGIEIKEIDVRSLRFPTILEGEPKINE